MWLHPKDKVQIGKEKFTVKEVSGLYSCVPVKVVLQKNNSSDIKTIPLLEFNNLHDQGKIKVTQSTPRITRGY